MIRTFFHFSKYNNPIFWHFFFFFTLEFNPLKFTFSSYANRSAETIIACVWCLSPPQKLDQLFLLVYNSMAKVEFPKIKRQMLGCQSAQNAALPMLGGAQNLCC